MNRIKMPLLAIAATLSLTSVAGTSRDISYAVEDAARSTVKSLAGDVRVKGVKSIVFVKLNLPEGKGNLRLDSNLSQVFEAALASQPESFTFVTHDTHDEEWKLIDGVFDQAKNFTDYDPKTCPALNKLKLADALLFGQVIDCAEASRKDAAKAEEETSVRIALRLLKISTGEQIWGGVINGKHVVTTVLPQHDLKTDLTNEAKGYLTLKNIVIAVGGLIGLVFVFVLIGKMKRVC